jgi:hypothetical protein
VQPLVTKSFTTEVTEKIQRTTEEQILKPKSFSVALRFVSAISVLAHFGFGPAAAFALPLRRAKKGGHHGCFGPPEGGHYD